MAGGGRTMRKAVERLRWRLWGLVVRHPKVCPANAHSLIIWGNREQRPWIGWMCRDDCERNGSCWCGKVRSESHPVPSGRIPPMTNDEMMAKARAWVAEVSAAYADGGYAAGDGPRVPLDEMEYLLAEVERLMSHSGRSPQGGAE